MRSTLFRLLLPTFSLLMFGAPLAAQTSQALDHPEHAGGHGPTCGTARRMQFDRAAAIRNTAARTPELYRRAVDQVAARAKGAPSELLSSSLEQTFWAPDYVAMQYIQVKAVCVHVGAIARVWVDVDDTSRSDLKAKLPVLITALEDSTAAGSRNPGKGIIENDVDVFGPTPSAVGDGVQDFLLFDISDQGILGFFDPTDQLNEEFSNLRNLLYIDSREGMIKTSSILNTLAHEFQHLIHFGIHPDADLFINEGCSEVAGLMNGYPDRSNVNYLRNTNVDMFSFPMDGDGNIQAYERALTLTHYLYEQLGERFLRELTLPGWFGMNAVNRAMGAVAPGAKWEDIGRGFAVANWLQTGADPRHAYRVNLTSVGQRRAKPLRTYTAAGLRLNDSVTLQPYGVTYLVYDAPPALTMTFTAGYPFRVMAIAYRGDSYEVLDFEPGAPVRIGEEGSIEGAYDRVILVLMESGNVAQKITWSVNRATSGIEDDAVVSATRFVSVTPNPVITEGSIAIATAGAEPVRLELYTLAGARVRTLVDGALETGRHSIPLDATGLAAGSYIARLTQGSTTATHLMIVE